MKKTILACFAITILAFQSNAQANSDEIKGKNGKGKTTLIKFKTTQVTDDDESLKSFAKKQFKANAKTEFKAKSDFANLNKAGFTVKKLQQYYDGIKVEFATQTFVTKNGFASSLSSEFVDVDNVTKNPAISESQALQFALTNIGASSYKWQNAEEEAFLKKEQNNLSATYYPKAELVVLGTENNGSRLAYKFDIYAEEPLSRDFVYVDAENGTILLKNAQIKDVTGTAATRYSGTQSIGTYQSSPTTYILADYSLGSGIFTYNTGNATNYARATEFIDADNNWTALEYNNSAYDNAAFDAHWGAMQTYNYFLNVHNRNSFNGGGAAIKSYVHYGRRYENAFWDGTRMTYGDGATTFWPLTSIDVVGHEIGHGVCTYTADLVYANESGAINEALSDIWGSMIEYYSDPTNSSKLTYKIGEQIYKSGGWLRDMENPKTKSNPSTYKGQYYYTGTSDNGGVHSNSGVFNHWFYILAEGKNGTNDLGNSYNVNGIGKDKAAQITYRSESVYFTANTTFAQARTFTIQAAEDLYGVGSTEAVAVCQAWYAVGVGDNSCANNVAANFIDGLNNNSLTTAENTSTFQNNNSIQDNQEHEFSAVAYPNPTVNNVNVKLPEGYNTQDVNINVYDKSGHLVQQVNPESTTSQISLAGYDNGVFIIRVQQGNKVLANLNILKN
ncbi:MAG: M4 family metallopeptidase [Alphaproteobacteria bacterium]|nr:M4 family metallopeptidase [Alphaproteobacteria bacterium]